MDRCVGSAARIVPRFVPRRQLVRRQIASGMQKCLRSILVALWYESALRGEAGLGHN